MAVEIKFDRASKFYEPLVYLIFNKFIGKSGWLI